MARGKSQGGAPSGPSSLDPNEQPSAHPTGSPSDAFSEDDAFEAHNRSGETSAGDPQEEHERRLQGENEEDDTPRKVKIGAVGEKGQAVKGHPLKEGTVIELSPKEIAAQRAGGVPLLAVPDDYDGEVYDVSVPYEAKSSEEAA